MDLRHLLFVVDVFLIIAIIASAAYLMITVL